MNRIVLIGNGFDKAHDMKTGYDDFINDYWGKIGKELNKVHGISYKDQDIELKSNFSINSIYGLDQIKTFNDLNIKIKKHPATQLLVLNYILSLISEKTTNSWVDIETEFYDILKKTAFENMLHRREKYTIDDLNIHFERIVHLLEEYLSSIPSPVFRTKIHTSLYSPFKMVDFPPAVADCLIKETFDKINKTVTFGALNNDEDDKKIEKLKQNPGGLTLFNLGIYLYNEDNTIPDKFCMPDNSLFLNFNYTTTENLYTDKQVENQVIHIHGELNSTENPIIFGYGDEIDESYFKIENLNDNKFLKYIKSTNYHNTDNYRKMLNFIETGQYQVVIMGHSCGNSDRTLLNTLFEHENCVSIKVYYHEWYKDGVKYDNYSDLIMNISRNFKDKKLMRARVVNKTYCEPLLKAEKPE